MYPKDCKINEIHQDNIEKFPRYLTNFDFE